MFESVDQPEELSALAFPKHMLVGLSDGSKVAVHGNGCLSVCVSTAIDW